MVRMPRSRAVRPGVEQLEDRSLPATTITGVVTEYVVPSSGRPSSIAVGPSGSQHLWFTDNYNNRVGRVRPNGVFETFFAVPTAHASPTAITAGPDGNMWFLEPGVDQVAKITPAGQVTEYRILDGTVDLGDQMVAGPDGNLWFLLGSGTTTTWVGKMTPAGQFSKVRLPGDSRYFTPSDLTVGPDDALWMTQPWKDQVVRLTTDGVVQEFTTGFTPGSHPVSITAGPDDALWFTEVGIDGVGRITTEGEVTEFTTNIRPSSLLGEITAGPDGALWFVENGRFIANQIGRITTGGVVSEFAVPTYGHSQFAITPGPDGNVWFTEHNEKRIGKVDLSSVVPKVEFSTAGYVVAEDGGSATVTVVRTGNTAGEFTVRYSVSDDSALGGLDYTPVSGELVFADGQTRRTFTIPILNDAEREGREMVNLRLDSASGAFLGRQSAALLTINDDEPPPFMLAWGQKVTPEFRDKVMDIADDLGVNPNFLMAAMEFESRLNPAAQNPVTLATGLIQFMPATAVQLGTTIEGLKAMDGVTQLDYVKAYFDPVAGRMHSLGDVYMQILWPRGVGKANSYVLFRRGSSSYRQNRGLDRNRDGKVTKSEATSFVQQKLNQGLLPDNAAPMN